MSSASHVPFRVIQGDNELTTAIVSDSLDVIGYRNQVMHTRLVPLVSGSRAFGRSSTVQFVPSFAEVESPYDDAIAFIDALVEGDVAVIATDGNYSTGYWGELFSAAAIGRRAAGMITDGNVRDTLKIERLGFPAFSAGHRPIDFRGRMRISAMHHRVEMSGVGVDHGDLILADDDGVVVIPQCVEREVLEVARARASAESAVLIDLLAGSTLRTVWDRYKVL